MKSPDLWLCPPPWSAAAAAVEERGEEALSMLVADGSGAEHGPLAGDSVGCDRATAGDTAR